MFYILPFSSKDESRQGGFSLLEVALILMIIGVTSKLSTRLWISQNHRNKDIVTAQNQERIFQALGAFLRTYRYLPAPASPIDKHVLDWGSRDEPLDGGILVQGIVPFKELGLSENVARDGYNNFFTYVIDKRVTKSPKGLYEGETCRGDNPLKFFYTASSKSNSFHALQVFSEGHHVNVPSSAWGAEQHLMEIIILLVSHGASGEGSFQKDGSRRPVIRGGICKKMNAEGGNKFCLKPSKGSLEFFDDVIRYESRMHMGHYYAGIPCQLPKADVNIPGFRWCSPDESDTEDEGKYHNHKFVFFDSE